MLPTGNANPASETDLEFWNVIYTPDAVASLSHTFPALSITNFHLPGLFSLRFSLLHFSVHSRIMQLGKVKD